MSPSPCEVASGGIFDNPRAAFEQAAAFFVDTVGQIGPDGWDGPGLGEWSVRDLVGHTSRALLTVESYLDRPVPAVEVSGPAAYFLKVLQSYGDPADVARRGREAGAALGDNPAAAARDVAARVQRRLAEVQNNPILATPAGGMTLTDYLPTRVFELVVHTLDLANAIAARGDPPTKPLAMSLHLAADLALSRGEAQTVILALTGRHPLPDGFSLV